MSVIKINNKKSIKKINEKMSIVVHVLLYMYTKEVIITKIRLRLIETPRFSKYSQVL